MPISLAQARKTEFPMVDEYTYLNTASQGPWPQRTVSAVQAAAAAMQYVNTPQGMPETPPQADLALAAPGAANQRRVRSPGVYEQYHARPQHCGARH